MGHDALRSGCSFTTLNEATIACESARWTGTCEGIVKDGFGYNLRGHSANHPPGHWNGISSWWRTCNGRSMVQGSAITFRFGNRASYCVTTPGGSREPTYYQLAMGKSMSSCAELVKARGYKYMNFWSNDGRCRGLHSCPYEKLSPHGYDGYCKTYTVA